jgi:predicted regulator of Ras-like GTPase activity (Roadblock/LC7/MglB family)
MAFGLSAEQGRVLNVAIADFVVQADAAEALLTDNTGNVLAQRSDRDAGTVQTIAALCSGAFCATKELAKLVGERTFLSISHQGEEKCIYVRSLADQFLLLVLFGRGTTEGLVKLYVRHLAETLEPLLRQIAGQTSQEAAGAGSGAIHIDGAQPVFRSSQQRE